MKAELTVDKFNDLVNLLTEIKSTYDAGTNIIDTNYQGKLKDAINAIFDNHCTTAFLTNNVDRPMFGIRINPVISQEDALKIIFDDVKVSLSTFAAEIDMNLFKNYNPMEIAAYLVEDIASLMNPNIVDSVRALLDLSLLNEGKTIAVQNSIAYTQILIFGIKDIIYKVTSLLYKDIDMIGANEYTKTYETGEILTQIADGLKTIVFEGEDVTAAPKLGILQWCLMIYDDLDDHYRDAEKCLQDAMVLTGSQIEQLETKKTLKAIQKAVNEIVAENANVYQTFCESFFGRLKRNGLRSITDDLFEFKIRLKNCEDIDEAMYILHQINSRIAILEDYIDTEDISPVERTRWQNLIADYVMLRSELAKKKIGNNKTYGIFVDYDKLDQLG